MPAPRPESALTPLVVGLLALGCKGPPPDQVRLELPELVLSSDPTRATVHVRRSGASLVSSEKMEFAVTPGDVASVTPDGTLVCRKTGDAKVVVSVQGVKDEAALHCRLVDRLSVGTLPLFDLAKPPVVLAVQALSKSGAALDDVPISVSSDRPQLLTVTGSTLTPLSVGETSLSVRAGGKTQKFPVRIVRTITAEALPLEGGHRIYYGLPAGKYELDVSLPVEKDVSVEWRGAPYCSYKGHGRTHDSSCVLEGKGGAVVDNPAFLLTGDTKVTGAGITIREVP